MVRFPAAIVKILETAKAKRQYVTTRARGSGLGLAIAKKTLEDHRGSLVLSNKDEGGACIVLTLPKRD